jgi:hypothetical protein
MVVLIIARHTLFIYNYQKEIKPFIKMSGKFLVCSKYNFVFVDVRIENNTSVKEIGAVCGTQMFSHVITSEIDDYDDLNSFETAIVQFTKFLGRFDKDKPIVFVTHAQQYNLQFLFKCIQNTILRVGFNNLNIFGSIDCYHLLKTITSSTPEELCQEYDCCPYPNSELEDSLCLYNTRMIRNVCSLSGMFHKKISPKYFQIFE